MCFLMDPTSGKKVCYVQFPQRFDGIDRHDRYSNRNVVFFDVCILAHSLYLLRHPRHRAGHNSRTYVQINMKGLDGLQGPIYVGTGCVFRRQALYGFDAPAKKKAPSKTCNCWPNWCCLCCGSRKNKKGKGKKDKNKKSKHKEASKQVHALETIEEGIEGRVFIVVNRIVQ